MQVQKTVFISYRRTNVYTARAVYQHLTAHGYDVFLDYENINSGSFEQVILNQIAARAHFVIVLTPSALERCAKLLLSPKDNCRRKNIMNCTEALHLDANDNTVYVNRGEVYFEMREYQKAVSDFKRANELDPALPHALAGLAISHHASGDVQKAKAYWRLLIGLDNLYSDAAWTGEKLNWHPALIEEARKLVAKL